MWSACDDLRSHDFLEYNLTFLEENPGYVASTSPNGMETIDGSYPKMSVFSLEGSVEQRFKHFLDNCWKSHGIFYALVRTCVLRECSVVGKTFLGADWAVDLYVASRGQINRTACGFMISGANGVSSGKNAWRAFRVQPIEWVLPFFYFSSYALNLSKGFKISARILLAWQLLSLNACAAYHQMFSELYQLYCTFFKAKRKQTISEQS